MLNYVKFLCTMPYKKQIQEIRKNARNLFTTRKVYLTVLLLKIVYVFSMEVLYFQDVKYLYVP